MKEAQATSGSCANESPHRSYFHTPSHSTAFPHLLLLFIFLFILSLSSHAPADNAWLGDGIKIKFWYELDLCIFGEESQLGHRGVDLSPSARRMNITGYLSISLEYVRAHVHALTSVRCACARACVGLEVACRSAACDNEMPRVAKRHREAGAGCFSFGSCFTECIFSSFHLVAGTHTC